MQKNTGNCRHSNGERRQIKWMHSILWGIRAIYKMETQNLQGSRNTVAEKLLGSGECLTRYLDRVNNNPAQIRPRPGLMSIMWTNVFYKPCAPERNNFCRGEFFFLRKPEAASGKHFTTHPSPSPSVRTISEEAEAASIELWAKQQSKKLPCTQCSASNAPALQSQRRLS